MLEVVFDLGEPSPVRLLGSGVEQLSRIAE